MNLRQYLKKKNKKIVDFAFECGVTDVHMGRILSGNWRPSANLACKIEELTNGEVKAEDLIRKEEIYCPCCGRKIPDYLKDDAQVMRNLDRYEEK